MGFFGIIFLPFTLLYSLAVRLRNHLYNIGYSRTINFEIPIILTGNLSAGGAGKTPTVEYLVRLLKAKYQLAILSRGYKRKTHGFHLASGKESYKTIGDEPLQYYNKWQDELTLAVGENRVQAIPKILFERPDTQVILMDDGYQHRAINPDLKILLTEYSQPFFKDYLLPSGWLREPRKEARRADVIVVTKSPLDITSEERESFHQQLGKYCKPGSPVFFSSLKYGDPKPLFNGSVIQEFKNVIVISGIANPIHFENYISSKWNILNARHFRDHHIYKSSDIKTVREIWEGEKEKSPVILTTEKDATKLVDPEIKPLLDGLPIYIIPMEMIFVENGSEFDALINQAIEAKGSF